MIEDCLIEIWGSLFDVTGKRQVTCDPQSNLCGLELTL